MDTKTNSNSRSDGNHVMTMNHQRALEILEIAENEPYDEAKVKKQYHRMALKFHPDKNKNMDTAVTKFQDINAAYQFLSLTNGSPINETSDYKTILLSFLRTILKNEVQYRFIYSVIELVQKLCISRIREIFDKIDRIVLYKIYYVLDKHRDILHLSDEIMTAIYDYLTTNQHTEEPDDSLDPSLDTIKENDEMEYVVLLPSLEKILLDNVYVFHKHGVKYIIPLWIEELVYEQEDHHKDLCIMCVPKLDADTEMIDADNNLHIWRMWNIAEIWREKKNDKVTLEVRPTVKYEIDLNAVKMVPKQEIILYGKGIAKMNDDNVYDVSVRGDIILHLTLTLTIDISI